MLIILEREKVSKVHKMCNLTYHGLCDLKYQKKKMDKSCTPNRMEPISLMNVFQADILTKCMFATSKTDPLIFQTISLVLWHIIGETLIALKREKVGKMH